MWVALTGSARNESRVDASEPKCFSSYRHRSRRVGTHTSFSMRFADQQWTKHLQDLLVSCRCSRVVRSDSASVEHKKTQKAKGVPESSLGDVKDQPPLPGKPSAQQVVQHVLGHQGVLRRLMDKVIREEKERAVKEGSSHRWIESSNPALSI